MSNAAPFAGLKMAVRPEPESHARVIKAGRFPRPPPSRPRPHPDM